MKIIIVGGVAGGATAAARLRRISEEAEIVLFERDEYISYANCGLPYYIGGIIADKNKLQVQTVDNLSKRYNLDIRVKSEVIAIDRANKKVKVKNLISNEEYEESYDKLILSCGAKPIKPPFKGLSEAKNIFTLRNIPDTYAIKDYAVENKVKNAVVVGGGFIGVEVAENLRELGINVTIVEMMDQVLKPFDYEMAQIIHQELNNNGVGLVLGDGVKEFSQNGANLILNSGKVIATEMTILAIGVSPENTLAKISNIKIGQRGHLVVDSKYNVSDIDTNKIDKDVFAVGDMIEVINPLDDTNYAVSLAWGANRQARIVSDIIFGKKTDETKILGTSALKVFSLVAASTGANETMLKSKGIDYRVVYIHRSNHAGYYPGSSILTIKTTYDFNTGKIYGAQAIGKDGTEKRIDVLATAISSNKSIYDLSDLELCYAPPFSSAKDPVNIIGYVAENIRDKAYQSIHHYEVDDLIENGNTFIDVRTPFEYANGSIKNSININIDDLRENLDKLPKDKNKKIYVYCAIGLRGYLATQILKNNGYKNIFNLNGGYNTYKKFKYSPGQESRDCFECDSFKKEDFDEQQAVNKKKVLIDLSGLQCPGPLMQTYEALNRINEGDIVIATATDPGYKEDIKNWCKTNNHKLLNSEYKNGVVTAEIQKGNSSEKELNGDIQNQQNATMIVFSGDFDKTVASMIVAQGAVAQGKNVTIFFTFWGLNVLRKANKVKVKKTFIEKIFGFMMPRGTRKLPLSRMNMSGMGVKMIKSIMKKKNVDSLENMIEKVKSSGVRLIACTMSMDLMGIKKEELIDGIEYAGVATYISSNENVGTTLFI